MTTSNSLRREKTFSSRHHHWAVIGELGAVEFTILGIDYHLRKPTETTHQELDRECLWIPEGCYRRETSMGGIRAKWIATGYSDETIYTELEKRYEATIRGRLRRRNKREEDTCR